MFLESVLASAGEYGPEVVEQARRHIAEDGQLLENYRYPVKAMLEMLDVVGQAAQERGIPYGEALFQSGWTAGISYVRSSVGRVRAMVSTVSGVHRALEGIPNAAAQAVNFGQHSYRRVTPGSGELRFIEDLIGPAWNTGMVMGSVKAAFALEQGQLRYEISVTDEDASSFFVRLDW
ncbi:hypothetical protein CYFUS_002749 [Cystobacter fuscus]|uniref:Heme NO-binding domain-containing protein n=2 Tax=Cystobacter fuscus TaxID=43 RepID=A0A250J1E5_9BACT|nr:hypothetical protein CYFUS_002749 [Cystobacter fuscus]